MKSKAALLLMEQLVMVLIFSLAAAVCLQMFVRSNAIAQETYHQDEAVRLAQNAAEMLKASGDAEQLTQTLAAAPYRLEIREQATQIPELRQACIFVLYEGRTLYTLQVGWREVAQ